MKEHLIKHIVKQILFEDYRFSPEYELMKKYEDEKGIYVRFSSRPMIKKVMMTTTKKSEFGSTFHSDPTGVYAFPLEYVLKHYKKADFNIFFSGEYMYVYILKDLSKNKFIVSKNISGGEAKELLQKLYEIENIGDMIVSPGVEAVMYRGLKDIISNAQKRINNDLYEIRDGSGKKIHNVLFFYLTQLSVDFLRKAHNNHIDVYNLPGKSEFLANGDVQRIRWLKAGYDAIEDRGKAVIYPYKEAGEAAQIIFFREDSFDIIDSASKESQIKAVNMTYGTDKNQKISSSNFRSHEERYAYFLRRIVAYILQKVLKDKILEMKWKREDIENILWGMESEQDVKYRLDYYDRMRQAFALMAYSSEQFLFGVGNKYYVFVTAEHRSHDDDANRTIEFGLQAKTIFGIMILEKEYGRLVYNNKNIDSKKFQSFEEFLTYIEKDIETNIIKSTS